MLKIPTILLLLLTVQTFGQKPLTVSDSIVLAQTWNKLVDNFTSKNTSEIRKSTFERVNCASCMTEQQALNSASIDYSVPVDEFIQEMYSIIPNSKMWSVIKSKEKPKFWRLDADDSIYEVVIHTYKKNEVAKGHEGGQHLFQFKMVSGQFKLYGFTSVP